MGRTNAATDSDCRSKAACIGIAAAGISPPDVGTRYSWRGSGRKPLQEMTALLFLMVGLFAAAPALADTIYVSNEQDNTVSVIDSTTLKVTATLAVGRRPRGIALSQDMARLYIAAGDDDRIEV